MLLIFKGFFSWRVETHVETFIGPFGVSMACPLRTLRPLSKLNKRLSGLTAW
ncbi:hypothetical protein JCM19053_2224 [Vibrio sp. JCM 19053]|nr:hypothetical protein JCM19053_2224 [Vibrio sp. JCM 19053]